MPIQTENSTRCEEESIRKLNHFGNNRRLSFSRPIHYSQAGENTRRESCNSYMFHADRGEQDELSTRICIHIPTDPFQVILKRSIPRAILYFSSTGCLTLSQIYLLPIDSEIKLTKNLFHGETDCLSSFSIQSSFISLFCRLV